jgi:hypothetical protein
MLSTFLAPAVGLLGAIAADLRRGGYYLLALFLLVGTVRVHDVVKDFVVLKLTLLTWSVAKCTSHPLRWSWLCSAGQLFRVVGPVAVVLLWLCFLPRICGGLDGSVWPR